MNDSSNKSKVPFFKSREFLIAIIISGVLAVWFFATYDPYHEEGRDLLKYSKEMYFECRLKAGDPKMM